jgi:hypothetical protein
MHLVVLQLGLLHGEVLCGVKALHIPRLLLHGIAAQRCCCMPQQQIWKLPFAASRVFGWLVARLLHQVQQKAQWQVF